MSTERFPSTQHWKIPNTGEKVLAAAFSVPDNQFGRYVRLTVLNKGVLDGKFRVAIYSNRELTKIYAASNWRSVRDIAHEVGGFGAVWRGVWGFEFPLPWPRLQAGTTYFMTVESTDYVRDGMAAYVAFCLDWPFEINTQNGDTLALAFELYGYRKVSS